MFERITTKINRRFFRYMADYDIDFNELKKKQFQGAIIIDVRNNKEFNEGHIEGSINIPEYEISWDFTNKIKNRNIEIVLYCSSGYRSVKAYKKLKRMGYKNIFNLYGGLETIS